MSDSTQLLVVGAGPAGLATAETALTHAAPQGLRVALLDEQTAAGGQIYRAVGQAGSARRAVLGADYAAGADLLAVLDRPALDYRPGSVVWEVTRAGRVSFTQGGRARALAAEQIVLCGGALERPMPFPGWTLPGVMTCGAAQILLKSSGLFPREQVVLAGSGPLLLLLAGQLLAAGAKLVAVVETTPAANYRAALPLLPAALRAPGVLLKGLGMIRALRRSGVPWYRGATDLRAVGGQADGDPDGGVRPDGETALAALQFVSGGSPHRIACRCLLLHQGVVPSVQISRSLRLAHDWDPAQRCWRPRVDDWGGSEVPGIALAGDGGGIVGAKAAAAQGRIAALGALYRLGLLTAGQRDAAAAGPLRVLRRELAPRPFLDRLYRPDPAYLRPADETLVCRCEEVTAGQIRGYAALGCLGPNQAKAFGRSGMGPCQGRVCGLLVSELIAEARGVTPVEVGYYRIRAPIKPVTLGELAALDDTD